MGVRVSVSDPEAGVPRRWRRRGGTARTAVDLLGKRRAFLRTCVARSGATRFGMVGIISGNRARDCQFAPVL